MKDKYNILFILLFLSIIFSENLERINCIKDHGRIGRVQYEFEEILESENFIIHYTISPLDSFWVNGNWSFPYVNYNYVQSIMDLLEYSLQIYLDQGWLPPPPDCDESIADLSSSNHCFNFGGNAKYDIYISNEGVGLVAPENLYPIEPYTSGWTSYMHISSLLNQYEEYPSWSHHVIAHELHHAIQMRYGSGTSGTPGNYTYNLWFFEQSATYMENVIFPNSNHLRTMLGNCDVVTPLTFPEHPIGYRFEIYPYRSALWQKFLVENYNDSSIVRYQWEEYGLEFATGENVSLYPIYNNSILRVTNNEFDLEKAIVNYGIWRYFSGERYMNNQHFAEGDYYCTSKTFTANEISSIFSENGSSYLIDLPNETNNILIETAIPGLINMHYLEIHDGNINPVEINMTQLISEFTYYQSENTNHALIITSGYTGSDSEEITLNISLNEPIIIGDFNNDLEVNVVDIVLIVTYILEDTQSTTEQIQAVDLNQDETINILDIILLVILILED